MHRIIGIVAFRPIDEPHRGSLRDQLMVYVSSMPNSPELFSGEDNSLACETDPIQLSYPISLLSDCAKRLASLPIDSNGFPNVACGSEVDAAFGNEQ